MVLTQARHLDRDYLQAALLASGAAPDEASQFADAVLARLTQLERICQAPTAG
jgi:hypothetical protein